MIKLSKDFIDNFSSREQLVMLRLLLIADDNGYVRISYRELAKSCEISLQVCRTTLKNLVIKDAVKKYTNITTNTTTNTAANTAANTASTFVSICDYDNYRVGKKKSTQQLTQQLTQQSTQPLTQENVNNLQLKCKKREKAFEKSLIPFVVSRGGEYQPQMIREFFNYWTEKNKTGTKMRFELEKTWETSRRLMTWKKRKGSSLKTSSQTILNSSEMNYDKNEDW